MTSLVISICTRSCRFWLPIAPLFDMIGDVPARIQTRLGLREDQVGHSLPKAKISAAPAPSSLYFS